MGSVNQETRQEAATINDNKKGKRNGKCAAHSTQIFIRKNPHVLMQHPTQKHTSKSQILNRLAKSVIMLSVSSTTPHRPRRAWPLRAQLPCLTFGRKRKPNLGLRESRSRSIPLFSCLVCTRRANSPVEEGRVSRSLLFTTPRIILDAPSSHQTQHSHTTTSREIVLAIFHRRWYRLICLLIVMPAPLDIRGMKAIPSSGAFRRPVF
jgi:hypothetical protein